jgi:ERCC4-related helicase
MEIELIFNNSIKVLLNQMYQYCVYSSSSNKSSKYLFDIQKLFQRQTNIALAHTTAAILQFVPHALHIKQVGQAVFLLHSGISPIHNKFQSLLSINSGSLHSHKHVSHCV